MVFKGDWSLPVKEAEAANSMVNRDVDVLTCYFDSPKVGIDTTEKGGICCTGYHANQAQLAPKGYLTGTELDWSKIYTDYALMLKAGKTKIIPARL